MSGNDFTRGGIVGGEGRVVLETGERVLSRDEVRALGRALLDELNRAAESQEEGDA